MLVNLTIKDVVLIDRISIEFGQGFCALTGETGAGKSILLDALSLVMGARSEVSLVRKGAKQASVTAEFHITEEHPVPSLLRNHDLESDTVLILRRTVNEDGRSRAFINDQAVSAGLLRQVGDMLVEIHGQFETQTLLDPKTHRTMLDAYAGIDTGELSRCWNSWKTAKIQLATEKEKMEKARTEEDYLRQSIEDLDALEPQEGEEEKLSALRERLMRREQIMESLHIANTAVADAETAMNTAWRAMERIGDEANTMKKGMDRANAEIQEVSAQIQELSTDMEHSEYSLEEIDDRLHALRGQARKHECSVDDLSSVRDGLAAQLSLIEKQDDLLADLMKEVEKTRNIFIEIADEASGKRQKEAEKLDGLVAKELPPLKLEKACFTTQVTKCGEQGWGAHGMDNVRFLVATNPGAEPGPLNKIASGGEMARFMLALKVVMAETGTAGTLVFDELDSGIGGATAAAIGERLARLATSRQILVVTHSPQVAARAQHHWIVSKDGTDEVKTNIISLDERTGRREEIARMLSGTDITEEARAAAGKLLDTGT